MATVGDLRLELEDVTTMKFIASAFTEAAAAHVQKIRKEFEQNRQFYEEVSWLYHLVQVSAKSEDTASHKKINENTLSVAVTSNQRFYGNINVTIMTEFLKKTRETPTDLMIIGSTGRDFMRSGEDTREFKQLQFAHDNPSADEVRAFLDNVKQYGKIIVYFPRFVTLVRQDVGVIDITHSAEIGQVIKDDEKYVLFEPDLSLILEFFERQVRSLLFLRVMLESDLARTAARLLTMSGAEERSTDLIKVKKRELKKLQNMIVNAKLLETFSAMKGVGKK